MLYKIERLKNPAAYLVTITEAEDYENQFQHYRDELNAAMESETEPITIIMDVQMKASIDSLATLASKSLKSGVQPLQHPNCKGLILITDSRMVTYSIDGLIKFGIARQIQAFSSVEEALLHV
jgi:hypothetical protein